MTVTNSNLNVSQLSLQSLKEENFSDIPLSEPPRLSNINSVTNKYSARRVLSNSHINTTGNKSNTNIVGLGIRRPSDSIVNESAKKDRPFSNYSTASNSSDASSQDEFTSRVSSLTSYTTSPFMSPIMPETKRESVADFRRTSKISSEIQNTPPQQQPKNTRAYSSPALHTELTPQQKFRLNRSQSRSTLKDIEKRYDDYESDDEIADDTFVWNVPLAIGGAASFFANDKHCQSPKLVNKVLNDSSQFMPPSQLPGLLHDTKSTPNLPVSPLLRKQPSFAHMSQAAKDISSFYNTSSSDYVRKELLQRKSFSESLPVDVINAQKYGFDDFKTISKEKASNFSSSRPVWLPPKSSEEVLKHKKEIHKVLSNAARSELKQKEALLKKKETDKVNVTRFEVISAKESLRSKHVKECGMLLFDTNIPASLEYDLLVKLSQKVNPQLSMKSVILEYESICVKCSSIDFTTKTREFENITNQIKRNYPIFQDEVTDEFKRLQFLIKLNQVSSFEMFPYLTSKLIIKGYSNQQIYILLRYFMTNSLNDQLLSKYYSQLDSNPVLRRKLSSTCFKDELNGLSVKLLLSILPKTIMLRFFEIMLCLNDYKLIYALVVTVLRDYHFGYNNIKDLINSGKELDFENNIDDDKFFEKLKFYYKKF